MNLDADVRARFTAAGAEPFDVDVSLDVADGETLVVLGPSGSGKTLLLEAIAGFHDHDGHVRVAERDVTDASPERRGFGFVFQDYALFPHLTVRENAAFGQQYRDTDRDPDALLRDLGVAALADRYPPTLSGGERQRVALARALAVDPDVLLLDEPLSALDVPTRQSLRDDLYDVLADATAVYVTHNRTTARVLGDRIAVMHDGDVVQVDDADVLFEHPRSRHVAEFTGSNYVPAGVLPGYDGPVAVRPEHVELVDAADGDVTASVARVLAEEAQYRVTLDVDDTTLHAVTRNPPPVGETVGLAVADRHVTAIAATPERD